MSYIADNPSFQGPTGAAIAFVNEGWDFFEDKINLYSMKALQLIDGLSYVPTVQPVVFNVEFPDIDALTGFTKPDRPTLPVIESREVAIPDAPDLQTPTAPAMVAAPAFDVATPLPISLPVQPGKFTVAAPGDAPVMAELPLPAERAMPTLPAFFDIVINEMAPLPEFAGRDPGEAPGLPDIAGASFTETPYTPALLEQLTPVVRSGLAGGQILSVSIEQALFGRMRERITRVGKAAGQATDELFSGRGFKLPPGAWAAQHAEQRQKNQDAVNEGGRDIAIQLHTQALESVKFAVVQGIALEQVLIAQHGQQMERGMQAARLLLDTHVALFNADVNIYNAKIERLKADASVYSDRVQALIEAYKASIAGQGALADANRANADVYQSQVQAVVEQMRGEVARVQAQAEIERNRIEGYRATVQGYAERVRAQQGEWDGYTAAVNAQQAGFRSYEIGVNAYSARVGAWAESERTKNGRYETDLKVAELRNDTYRSRIQQALAQLQAEQGRISALTSQSESIARMYQADATVEEARNASDTRKFQAVVEAATNRANIQLREAEIKIQDAARMLSAQLAAINGAAGALSQLTASAMSGVNFSAGVSGSGNESISHSDSRSISKSWSWGGESSDNDEFPIW